MSTVLHPWSTWDVMGEHVELVAHAGGGVFCSDDGGSERVPSVEGVA
jgi:hypothetical protein